MELHRVLDPDKYELCIIMTYTNMINQKIDVYYLYGINGSTYGICM